MEYQSSLHKKLHAGNFVFTAETTPPDASDQDVLLKKVEPLRDVADAVNVTDSPGAKVHMSALTAAIILAQNGMESCILPFPSLFRLPPNIPFSINIFFAIL